MTQRNVLGGEFAPRWAEPLAAGKACPMAIEATHMSSLEFVDLDDLKAHARFDGAICVWLRTLPVRYAVVASRGVWRSLVARFVRDEEVVGSNPATPTALVQVKALTWRSGRAFQVSSPQQDRAPVRERPRSSGNMSA